MALEPLTAIKGRPHCGYFVPALKIGQLLAAGCNVVILLADMYGLPPSYLLTCVWGC